MTTTHGKASSRRVVGIDVGGAKKGFHAVAFDGRSFFVLKRGLDANELADWCAQEIGAQVVAVDAPCRWSADGGGRPAERQLAAMRVWCFFTPTRAAALQHPNRYYEWMLRGEAMFEALQTRGGRSYALCADLATTTDGQCIETFPHAATWHLLGGQANAKRKRTQRRDILARTGCPIDHLTNIDWVDAALCALVAYRFERNPQGCVAYGDAATGLIILPRRA